MSRLKKISKTSKTNLKNRFLSIVFFHTAHTADLHTLESALEESAAILAAALASPDRSAAPQVFGILCLRLFAADKVRNGRQFGAG